MDLFFAFVISWSILRDFKKKKSFLDFSAIAENDETGFKTI
jgi:hypothetical protein